MKKAILLVGIGHAHLSEAAIALAKKHEHELMVVELQGPPAPAPAETLKNYAAEFSATLAREINPVEPKSGPGQAFYLSLPKYKKRKP